MHGCPATRGLSAVAMGRVCYGLGLGGVSWAGALVGELEEWGPSSFRSSVASHAAPAVLILLPVVVALAVFRSSRRHLAAFVAAPLAFTVALGTFSVTGWLSGLSPEDAPANVSQLVDFLVELAKPGLVAGLLATLPLGPILSLAKAGSAIDADLRARVRIGRVLAGASAVQVIAFLLSFDHVACAPSVGVLLFGLVLSVISQRQSARLHEWVSRVSSGELAGVRIREEEAGDASLYVPDLVSEPSPVDAVVLEAFAEHPGDGPYRRKRSAVPLARVARDWIT